MPPAEDLVLQVVRFVNSNAGCSKTDIEDGVRGRAKDVRAARDDALDSGLIRNEAGARKSRYVVTEQGLALIVPSSANRPSHRDAPDRPVVPPYGGRDDGRRTTSQYDPTEILMGVDE